MPYANRAPQNSQISIQFRAAIHPHLAQESFLLHLGRLSEAVQLAAQHSDVVPGLPPVLAVEDDHLSFDQAIDWLKRQSHLTTAPRGLLVSGMQHVLSHRQRYGDTGPGCLPARPVPLIKGDDVVQQISATGVQVAGLESPVSLAFDDLPTWAADQLASGLTPDQLAFAAPEIIRFDAEDAGVAVTSWQLQFTLSQP
ncbi:hypothetical protein Q0M94_25950 (plasmid) [Deinococcus radiomollis]|uniref:hypothetical protein n=1 Tax=Deinococcus radiomollis TaxID=468916 RepID=UPI00389279AE